MKLRISCWAEDLAVKAEYFAVLTLLHKAHGVKPTVLGQTEVIANTKSPDWTKTFDIDYELGQEQHIVFSLYKNNHQKVGSTLFEVGSILGHPGGVLAKELKNSTGYVAARVEEFSDNGQLQFQLCGYGLKNADGIGFSVSKSDPFYEIQRERKYKGKRVWDVVYRSPVIDNNLSPIFPEVFIDLDILGNGRLQIVVYDSDPNQNEPIGSITLNSYKELMEKINPTALALTEEDSNIDPDVSFLQLTWKGEETGKLLVAQATVSGVPEPPAAAAESAEPAPEPEIAVVQPEPEPEPEIAFQPEPEPEPEPEIVLEEEEEIVVVNPSFVNYVSGGCQLRVLCSIDATSSNGNPRESTSLHYFNDNDFNSYEKALFGICSILEKYDSDRSFPVFGFGAKMDGTNVDQCFSIGTGEAEEVEDGVQGIIRAYRHIFRSGIVMSSPRDFSEVIRTAGMDALKQLEEGQSYSILLIFTNGSPEDSSLSSAALKEVEDAPLSIVIVGVGEDGDFAGCKQLAEAETEGRDKIRFVHFSADQDVDELTKPALHDIPAQLEQWMVGHKIFPKEELEGVGEEEEVVVQPYSEEEDIEVPMEFSESGEITVTEDVKPPERKPTFLQDLKRIGQEIRTKIKKSKEYAKLKKTFNKKNMRKARNKAKKFFRKFK